MVSHAYLRCNCAFDTRFPLKLAPCSVFAKSLAKSLVNRCKIHLLLIPEDARCKKSLVTCYKFCCYSLQNLLVAKRHSLLVAKITCYLLQKLSVIKNHSLLVAKIRSSFVAEVVRCKVAKFARCKNSPVSRCKIWSLIIARSH